LGLASSNFKYGVKNDKLYRLHMDGLPIIDMQELLNHPAVQAGLAPFIVGLIVSELFLRIRLSGLAVIAGFAITVYLASDFTIEPLTASRKIVMLGIGSAFFGLLFGSAKAAWRSWVLPTLASAAALWTVSRILEQQPTSTMIQWGGASAAYVFVLVWSMDKLLEKEPVRVACTATALGIGTGGAALIGASALLGQFGLALGAAASAPLIIQLISNQTLPSGRMLTFPLSLIAGLTGCLAVLSATLPWYALAILAGIPLTSWLLPLPHYSVRVQSIFLTSINFIYVACALYITWRVAGSVPL
jgi:hypothetical protein